MTYQFDTNIVLHYMRQSSVMHEVEGRFQPFAPENEIWICVVSIGEIRSIAIQSKWGMKKLQQLEELLDILNPINIWALEFVPFA